MKEEKEERIMERRKGESEENMSEIYTKEIRHE
jgi:hypothetical protein